MRLGAMYIAALRDGLRLPLLLMLPEVFRICKALPALLRMVASMVRNACCIVTTFLEALAVGRLRLARPTCCPGLPLPNDGT